MLCEKVGSLSIHEMSPTLVHAVACHNNIKYFYAPMCAVVYVRVLMHVYVHVLMCVCGVCVCVVCVCMCDEKCASVGLYKCPRLLQDRA